MPKLHQNNILFKGRYFQLLRYVKTVIDYNGFLSRKLGKPEGNILIGGVLTLSGILFNQFKAFCAAIKLSMFTRPVFDKIMLYVMNGKNTKIQLLLVLCLLHYLFG